MVEKEYTYFVLNTPATWKTGQAESLQFLPEGGIALWPMQSLRLPSPINSMVGLVIDHTGNIFTLDADHCTLYRSSSNSKFTKVEGFGGCGHLPGEFNVKPISHAAKQPGATMGGFSEGYLALGADKLLVSDTFNHRIQIFDKQTLKLRAVIGYKGAGGLPEQYYTPGTFSRPGEIVVSQKKGHFFVVDQGNERIQRFDRNGEFPRSIGEAELQRPQHIALTPKDELLVLDTALQQVLCYNQKGDYCGVVLDFKQKDGTFPHMPSGLGVNADGDILVGDASESKPLKFYSWSADYAFLGVVENPHGPCRQIATDPSGNFYALCGQDTRVILKLNDASEYVESGTYYSRLFDSTKEDTRWHRVAIKGTVEEKTRIDIYAHSNNQVFETQFIRDEDWQLVLSSPRNGLTATDGLLQNLAGRYLRLKMVLHGDRRVTPRIDFAQIFLPRMSYLRYMPVTYQEDPVGKDFLERFLSIFETFAYGLELQIAKISRHFDAAATPDNFFEWLEAWLAVKSERNWSLQKRRDFLTKAYVLYQRRGTLPGLSEMIALFTKSSPRIIEHFRSFRPAVLGNNARLGVNATVAPGIVQSMILEENSTIGDFLLLKKDGTAADALRANAHKMTLLVDTSKLSASEEAALLRLIEDEKPAHTECCVVTGRKGVMQLGMNNLLGVNTKIGIGLPTIKLHQNAYLGKNTYLGTRYKQKGVLGTRSRINIDTVLN